jgi:hypothetical protein
MTFNVLKYGALAILLVAPTGAFAQGVVRGEVSGAYKGEAEGRADAGPVGGVVGATIGGAVGGVVGGVDGLLGIDQRPRFHEYVRHENRPSHEVKDQIAVGAVLAPEGVEYYDVPAEYGVKGNRYTIVNGQTVLVDPKTHKIVQIVQ